MEVVEKQNTPVVHASVPAAEPPLWPALRRRMEEQFRHRFEQEWGGKLLTHGRVPGPDAVRLDGNDYLAVTGHPRIVQAQVGALLRNREFIVQSGVFQHEGSATSRLAVPIYDGRRQIGRRR